MWNEMNTIPDSSDRVVGSDRVLAVLLELANYPDGIGLEDIAARVASPKSTVHRALASLRRAGLATQDGRGHYVLGDEFLRMAFTHHEARPDHLRVRPVLEQLAALFNEVAHYAVLEGRFVVYRSKVDPSGGAVKLSSVIGGRNPAHSTAVGKLLLSAQLADDAAVRAWVGDEPLEQRTERTITEVEAFGRELASIRAQGYAVDDQENEPGVNCLAVPAYLTSRAVPSGAVSISGLTYRTPMANLVAGVPRILEIVRAL